MTRAIKIYSLAIAGFAVGAVSFGLIQNSRIDHLRRQTEELRPKAAEVDRLKSEIQKMKGLSVDTNELAKLRSKIPELMELRGEVSQLRKTAGLNEEELKKEINRVRSEAEAKAHQAKLIRARQEAKERSKEVKSLLTRYLGVMREVTPDRYPASAEQLRMMAADYSGKLTFVDHWLRQLDRGGRSAEAMNLFEFIPHSTPPTKEGPESLLLRERQPRPEPDGGWVRAYGTTRGKVLELTSPNGDFTTLEREWSGSEERRQ